MHANLLKPLKNIAPVCCRCIFFFIFFSFHFSSKAQILAPAYPVPAEDISRGLNQSKLTVKLGFASSCNNTVVTITLPSSVSYVPGSITQINTSIPGATITESNISNLSAPVFSINGIINAGDLTFTINRKAGCGSAASGKDMISVTGSCGSITEGDPNINSYNLLSPSLSIIPPTPVTSAFIGTTSTNTTSITNGGNGCLDTLRYYVVFKGGSMKNTASNNMITANGASFAPFTTNGDTLFYKIFGHTIFGGDSILCNGESVSVTETDKVIKCNAAITYSAGWGNSWSELCQSNTTSGTVTMASGVAGLSVSVAEPIQTAACTPGTVEITYTNSGSGANAGALYNIIVNLGYAYNTNPPLQAFNSGQSMNNFVIKAGTNYPLSITTPGSVSTPHVFNLQQLITDPDGAGSGLDDLDGDGQYDDLAPGKTFTIIFNRIFLPDATTCPRPTFDGQPSTILNYTNMCGDPVTTLIQTGGTRKLNCCWSTNTIAPPQAIGGTPFTVQFTMKSAYIPAYYRPTDSLELFVTLPPGVSYAGNAKYHGSAAHYAVQTGQLLELHQKMSGNTNNYLFGNLNETYDFTFDLVYTCGTGGNVNIPIELKYAIDRSCGAVERLICTSTNINLICGTPCPAGIANSVPVATRKSFGWTDATMTAKVNPASLPAISLKTVTVYDTLSITSGGKQISSFNNLYYSFQMARVSGTDLLQFINGTFNYQPAGGGTIVSCPVTTALRTVSSTASLTKWVWNLSSLLGSSCGIPSSLSSGDSVWIDFTYRVNNPNSGVLLGLSLLPPTNVLSYLYNLDASNNQIYCDRFVPDMYFIGLSSTYGMYSDNAATLIGCTPGRLRSYSFRYHVNGMQPFENEFRPLTKMDSIVFILPTGVSFSSSTAPVYRYVRYTNKYLETSYQQVIANPVVNGQRISFINNGSWPLSDFSTSSSQSINSVMFYVVADCQVPETTGPLSITANYYGKDYIYSDPSPVIPFSQTTNINSAAVLGVDGSRKAKITVQNNTGSVQGVLPQHYWDIQISSTGTSAAPYLWMALNKSATGSISIDSVVLKPSGTILTAIPYGSGNKWYKISVGGLASGAVQQARIYFKYTDCNTDSILMSSGWNCTGYPSLDPGSYVCTAAQQFLKVIPQNSQVQISVDRQPGNGGAISMCSQDSVTVIVNSAQAANLVNPYIIVYPPTGINMPTVLPAEYPLGSGNWQNITTSAIGSGGVRINLYNHTGITGNGLPGAIISTSASSRQIKLKIPFTSDCSFTSGTQLNFYVFGNAPCGAAADGSGADVKTNPVLIYGSPAVAGMGMSQNLSASFINCATVSTLSVINTPVFSPTQAGDTAVYTLPAGMMYAGNFMAGSNCSSCTITVVNGSAGTTLVKLKLETGITSGTPMSAQFDVTAGGNSCGSAFITGYSKRDIAPLSCGATNCSSSSVITGTVSPAAVTLQKPNLVINSLVRSGSSWIPGGTGQVNLTYSNNGTMNAAANTYQIEFFCGEAATPFFTKTLSQAVAIGSSASETISFNIPAAPACNYGDYVVAKIQTLTAASVSQCLCNPASAVVSGGVALPVTLSSFTVTKADHKAILDWKTEQENNSSYTDILRSYDGSSFTEIGRVAAAGSSSISRNYSFTDDNPAPSVNHYKLRFTDIDGRYTYSAIRTISFSSSADINVYPNPASDIIYITATYRNSIQEIQLNDLSGKLVYRSKEVKDHILMDRFAKGTYLLRVLKSDGTTVIKKIQKAN